MQLANKWPLKYGLDLDTDLWPKKAI